MIGVVLRRKAGEGKAEGLVATAHYEDKPVARGWLNLRGEIVGEMARLGADPRSLVGVPNRYEGSVER